MDASFVLGAIAEAPKEKKALRLKPFVYVCVWALIEWSPFLVAVKGNYREAIHFGGFPYIRMRFGQSYEYGN